MDEGGRMFAAGVETHEVAEGIAVTMKGENLGTMWRDDEGWWAAADGDVWGPFANETLAKWHLYQDWQRLFGSTAGAASRP